MAGYTYLTWGALRGELLQRLQDAAGVNTPAAEADLYLTEALRLLNCLTFAWNIDYTLSFNPGDLMRLRHSPYAG